MRDTIFHCRHDCLCIVDTGGAMKTLALFVIAAALFIIWRILVDSLNEATMGAYYD